MTIGGGMAEVLSEFPLRNTAKYDWDKWLDGRIWRLVRGEDFDLTLDQFRNQVHNRARARNMYVTCQKHGQDALVIQATPR